MVVRFPIGIVFEQNDPPDQNIVALADFQIEYNESAFYDGAGHPIDGYAEENYFMKIR